MNIRFAVVGADYAGTVPLDPILAVVAHVPDLQTTQVIVEHDNQVPASCADASAYPGGADVELVCSQVGYAKVIHGSVLLGFLQLAELRFQLVAPLAALVLFLNQASQRFERGI